MLSKSCIYSKKSVFLHIYNISILQIINTFCCPRNMIKVRGNAESRNTKCFSGIIAACFAPISGCLAIGCCCVCCPLACCKGLWDALLHGPKKNRGSFVKGNDELDYQIGDMPGNRDKQIIILQKEVDKVL